MSETEKRLRIRLARQLLDERIHALAAGSLPGLMSCVYTWEATGRGCVSLILYQDGQLHSLDFTEEELLAESGQEGAEQLARKLKRFLHRLFPQEPRA